MSKPENPKLFSMERNATIGDLIPSTDITLRDLFAAAALIGYLSNDTLSNGIYDRAKDTDRHPEDVAAVTTYGQADAMLRERQKGGES